MARLTQNAAREILRRCGAAERHDFHALHSDIVARIIAEADAYGYRAPRNANGSRARYFHAHLVRTAERKDSA